MRGPAAAYRATAYWAIPSLLCLLLYWHGLRASYQMDDFAWLALPMRVHSFSDLLYVLFHPLAQGTIRPWSERLFFLAGWHFFGLHAGPLRAVVFLTQFANLILLSLLTIRVTGSRLAGFTAPVLWICNSSLYIPMAWTAAYNQIQCAFFLLLALSLWIRYTDTSRSVFYAAQFLVFVIGFGALEINVVYPALAALYALCFARRFLLRTVPMFVVSTAYAVLHRAVAPPQSTNIYQMFWDVSIFSTLGTYLRWIFGADRFTTLLRRPEWLLTIPEILSGVVLLVFIVAALWRRKWPVLFGAGWFLVTIAPFLPLKNHVSDYYVTIPVIGLAIVAAAGIAAAFRRGPLWFGIAAAAALLYAVPSAAASRKMTWEYRHMSTQVKTFLESLAYAHRLHSDKTLVIRNVDNDFFWAVFWDHPFQLVGLSRVYVAAECEPDIVPFPEAGTLNRFFLPNRDALAGMQRGEVLAYDLLPGGHLRNVTALYRSMQEHETQLAWPRYINFGQPLTEDVLRKGWWQPEQTFRWMSGQAGFVIRGPSQAGGELAITGFCPPALLRKGPLHLRVRIGTQAYPAAEITDQNPGFRLRFPFPPETIGTPQVEVQLSVDRTFQPPNDGRVLGAAISSAEVVP